MLNKKQIVTAGATLGIALATGFVMQNGDAVASRLGDAPEAQPQAEPAEAPAVVQSSILPSLPETPAEPEPVEMAALEEDVTVTTDIAPPPAPAAEPELVCETTLQAEATAAAMVRLDLMSACHPNERVTIHHEGMMFTAETDTNGAVSVDVPALNQSAIFIAAFPNNEGAMSQIDVPSLEFYDRVVLQWRGENALQLHAREFGADYGEEGHVWSETTRDASVAATGQGGFITTLGSGSDDTALLAEIYSFPTGFMTDDGEVALSVEAEVTAKNCARDIEAQSIQISPEAEPAVVDLVLSVPGCDAVGDFLVLKNMVQDLTLAAK
ncbi:hypothetical protein [Cognatishimia sp. MH4019]|uniref:hypothetical protein n=1 Tax=Cognatishimia sp. MH4019 TaxID=2854030 RepID=UPI001CD23628|nr:hypothetical protein [Cognatishimia sp. MH4019]